MSRSSRSAGPPSAFPTAAGRAGAPGAGGGGREPAPWVIQDLSFSVREGEFLTIIGPSGAGKTTLLNIIAQIDTASDGEVRFQSEHAPIGDAKALKPGLACRIGYVTQD